MYKLLKVTVVTFMTSIVLMGCVGSGNSEDLALTEKTLELQEQVILLQQQVQNLTKEQTDKEDSTSLEKENKRLQAEIADLKEANAGLEKQLEKVTQEESSTLESAVSSVTANRVSCKETYLAIDGGSVFWQPSDYYLEYNNKKYISFDTIKTFYNYDASSYGQVIKGFPLGDTLIKASGVISLSDIIKENEAEDDFENSYYKEIKLDGMVLRISEVGLESCVISKPLYLTNRLIKVGSTRTDVQRAYGRLGSNDEKTWTTFSSNAEYSEGHKTIFTFGSNDRVVEIKYGW